MTGEIAELLKEYSNNTLIEKLFVHTDKEYYLSGELIWLKIYAADGATNKPLKFSKICYVELLDSANIPVLQAKIALNDAAGIGSFYIPQSVNSGNYKLRAYSRWMKNFDASGFFEKSIRILNINRLPVITTGTEKRVPSLKMSFFPEGGNLLSGVDNKVAFQLYGDAEHNQHFYGYLVAGADTVQRFEPVYNGAGFFNFTPAQGNAYHVAILTSSGKSFVTTLPPIYSEGAVMQVTETESGFNLRLQSKGNGNGKLYVLLHSKGLPQNSQVLNIQNGVGNSAIDKSLLPDGVSTITIFNEQATPLCERIVFKHPSRLMDLNIETTRRQYNMREKVDITLVAAHGLSIEDSASVSMSVFSLDSLQQLPGTDISAYLLLASELKGPLENTGIYFSPGNVRSKIALELLLLTQGWRKFNWDQVLNRQKITHQFVPELQGHIITGKVTDKTNGSAAAGITAFISASSATTLFKTALSDVEGNIKADIKSFYGSNQLIVQSQQVSNLSFTIDDPFSKKYTATVPRQFLNHIKYPNTILRQHIGTQVRNIYNAEQLQQLALPAFVDSSAFYRHADYNYDLEKYTRFSSMEEVMREFVSIVDVRIKNKQVNFHVINAQKKEYFPNAPLNLLDGIPVFDFTRFFELDPFKVYSLDVVARQYVLGNSVFDGVLNWKTYRPALENYDFDKSTLVLNYEALQLQREFYAPVYDNEKQFESRLPDFRNVLHWKPDILLQSGKPFRSSFYTSDLPGRYAVVVQGLSSAGVTGTGITFFEVL
ncbi:hypothetical protein [Niabella hibiscisoli]|uniref:hypothetical protein n=1 Tax=Niabella hibiscisoli TaxID=1825928 RepID=UPI001F100218|nr:hypothetical protein [Niabella hibiscisoli]MCH5719438.1 hypothetical protein [Niabella hibiscisoli]